MEMGREPRVRGNVASLSYRKTCRPGISQSLAPKSSKSRKELIGLGIT